MNPSHFLPPEPTSSCMSTPNLTVPARAICAVKSCVSLATRSKWCPIHARIEQALDAGQTCRLCRRLVVAGEWIVSEDLDVNGHPRHDRCPVKALSPKARKAAKRARQMRLGL